LSIETARHHTYPISIIQMAITLINVSGVSFRSVSKIFLVMNLTFGLELRVPSHATALIWVKKQGIANFRNKDYFKQDKWILIVDESIQFGNKKLLAVVAVPQAKQNLGRSLTYKDLVPVILKSSESWKAEEIASEIRTCIDVEQILYVVSDNGNNLKRSYNLLGVTHIEDVGHKFSWIIKETLEKQPDFEAYTKHLSGLRGKLALSKFAHIIPPNQRIVSRFMNLWPLFAWGVKMLKLLDKNLLTEAEREKVEFVYQYKELIERTYALLRAINKVMQILKNKGFGKTTVTSCLNLLSAITDIRGKNVVAMITLYFEDTLHKMENDSNILCSSDILESCFGKYKSIVKANKSVGITDLCLCMATLMGDIGFEQTRHAMENVKTIDIKQWREENIGESLYAKRNNLLKKVG